MEKHKPLFVYDCDGTLQGPTALVWAFSRKIGHTHLSLLDFKAQHPGSKAMFPGMADIVRYTASIGNNILLSGGDPRQESCAELRLLKPFFKNWHFNGRLVPWGNSPEHLVKDNALVAQALLEETHPNKVIVFGDSLDDYMLAYRLSYYMSKRKPHPNHPLEPPVITFLRHGSVDESCLDSTIPVISVETPPQMSQMLHEMFWPVMHHSGHHIPKNPLNNISIF